MISTGVSLLPLMAIAQAMGFSVSQPAGEPAVPTVRRVVIRDQLIIRVPVAPKRSEPIAYTIQDGPRCFSSRRIVGARLAGQRSIDFLLENNTQMRVEMDRSCPTLDFYGGFYVQPNDDRLCARRDVIRTRMGGACRIESFKLLRPAPAPGS
ncbi:hypothetical protein [Sphingomicrobium sediminis]|uniref:Uncharacterized protein n=1 Tax=Sphingomicrobium sediminis TaxID=2950949 RepID=A0A9X2J1W2_9SPHN|nr:hypothetical protein [Sphingomicrobium sediminis]MCM8556405.1 hypothetical protein [Sphingomicrobium sediminis]